MTTNEDSDWTDVIADEIEDCRNPVDCNSDHHGHCANSDCANPNQDLLPPGYAPFCAECAPGNRPSAQDVLEETGLTPWALRSLRSRLED